MPHGTAQRSHGGFFDQYHRRRPAYPDALLDHVCAAADLHPGDRVLEIGCGTGQLTRSLLARGLGVSAIEPGGGLIALARRAPAGRGDVKFVNARLEDATLPRERFHALFCAEAMHRVDPDVACRPASQADRAARLGCPDAAGRYRAPRAAQNWPACRALEAILAGGFEQRENVSELWSWIGSHELARDAEGASSGTRRSPPCQG